ncbi:Amino acid/amide ABC transporter ATP-binding protein 1, HAAT family [Hyphomicrobiales bacterium]|nr:Amino acid/amide ABC transporter ATP-binding protein 1, HAAT family [Hyphomicrobiales bacterium]CAH1689369.1 Amino acid/amide ABC transporter ATP-binding protein 1, HAAT family [Hyphomicrobiales bacterium]
MGRSADLPEGGTSSGFGAGGGRMIVCHDIHKQFGGFRAVDGVSLTIPDGAITGLIGPNGAGKSTLFNVIAGVHKPTAGRITMAGEDITGLPPHALFARGVLRTFQVAHEFPTMSVLENLMMVPGGQSGETLWNTWVHRRRIAREEAELRARALDVLAFLELGSMRDVLAGNLSGGQKKLLEIGRTMMVDARIVFLDEVGAGVNRTLLRTIGEAIVRLNRERGYTFCVIEHDMDFIARLCDSVIVMAQGRILAEGRPAEIVRNERVIEAYLGTGLKNKVVAADIAEAMIGGAAS